MYSIQVTRRSYQKSIRKIHRAAVVRWKESGSKGLKPKLYASSELVIQTGLNHLPAPLTVSISISKGVQ